MSKAYIICGTGTDVGKSVVCAGLLKNLPSAQAVKIIQTGEELFDQNLYTSACPQGRVKTISHFKLAASPHLAAGLENKAISLEPLAQKIRREAGGAELTLLEGSGGIMVPLSDSATFLDLMVRLDYPVILVIRNALGAINQTLLSLEVLKRAGLKIEGLIFTHPDADYKETSLIAADNMRVIRQLSPAEVLAVVPHIPGLLKPQKTWSRLAACLKKAAARLLREPHRAAASRGVYSFDQKHLWHPYSPPPGQAEPAWLVEKTEGNYIYLKNGRKLLDGMSSWWCAIHGYARPELAAALKMQAQTMPHVMFGGLTHEPAIELGQSLLKILPPELDKIFWADSGSVAVEVALKMAVQYWRGRGAPQKTRIISHYGGYHGDTLGAMSVGDPVNGMHAGFKGFVPEQIFVPRPAVPFQAPFDEKSLRTVAATAAGRHRECAAIIIEPVAQGAGGMWFYHPDYLKGLREICRRHDLLLIHDEIATGFGRTGKMFASEWAGISPDIICLGKALTGGTMTFAATVCSGRVAEGISRGGRPLMHGPTFMGNPLACRVAQASLALLLSSDWAKQVRSIQDNLEKGLAGCRDIEHVNDVRVLGAIGVVEMKRAVNVARLRRYCAEKHGVWIRPFNNLVYVMPPYTVTADECSSLGRAVSQALEGGQWV
jgi:adenosylmethionine-8-amino-7-oxononanoate aminotransferase